MYYCYLNMKLLMVFQHSARTICLGKNGLMSYGPKASWLIIMQDSLKYNISQTSWGMKLKFCILLDIYRNNNFTQSFRMGLVRYPWACPELCEIMSHLKNELSYKVFCLWLGIHRSYKFFYSFQGMLIVFGNKELAISQKQT